MVYVISDLHGYPMDKFLKLLKQADFSDDDYLYIIGDVVDRNGDGGVQMLLWLMEQPNAQLILGNHEAMLLACDFLFDDITEDSIDSFNSEKIYNETLSVNDKDYILVHSGFENFSVNRKLSDYTVDELIWTRPELSDRYFNDIMTIFGHTPTMYYGDEYKGKIIKTDTWIDIDVGAGHGRGAVLLRLDDGKEFRLSEER